MFEKEIVTFTIYLLFVSLSFRILETITCQMLMSFLRINLDIDFFVS